MTSPGNKPKVIHSQFPRACPSPLTSPDNKTGDQVQTLHQRPSRPPFGAILAPHGESSTGENPVCQQVYNMPDQRTHPNARYNVSLVGRGLKPVITGHLASGTSHRQPALHTKCTTLFKQPVLAWPRGPKTDFPAQTAQARPSPTAQDRPSPVGCEAPCQGCKF